MAAAPFTFGLSAVVSAISGIFTHHAKAVKNEAAALNNIVPAVRDSFLSIFDMLNKGSISEEQAKAGLDETLSQYETYVYDTAGVKKKAGNGPDVVEKTWLKTWADKLKGIISSGGGTFKSDAIGSHAGFQGLQEFSITYTKPSPTTDPFSWGASELKDVATNFSGMSTQKKLLIAGAVLVVLYLIFGGHGGSKRRYR